MQGRGDRPGPLPARPAACVHPDLAYRPSVHASRGGRPSLHELQPLRAGLQALLDLWEDLVRFRDASVRDLLEAVLAVPAVLGLMVIEAALSPC